MVTLLTLLSVRQLTLKSKSYFTQEHHGKLHAILTFWSKNVVAYLGGKDGSNDGGLEAGSRPQINQMKQEIPTDTMNKDYVNASVKYSPLALELYKSSLENSGQDPMCEPIINRGSVIQLSQTSSEPKPNQVVEENRGKSSESVVAGEDLFYGETLKEEGERTDSDF